MATYVKNTWESGDTITAALMNHIEEGLEIIDNHLVSLDTTLTQEGDAAEAKATGNAIAAVESAIPAVDATLATSGAAADAKATGHAISEVENVSIKAIKTLSPIAFTWTSGYYMNASGTPTSNASYSYSNQVEVNEGDVLVGRLRMLTVFNSEGTAIYSGFRENLTSYTVPAGVSYVVVSVETNNTFNDISKLISRTTGTAELAAQKIDTARKGAGQIEGTGNLDSGHSITLPYLIVRKGFTFDFFGKVTSFSDLDVGFGSFKSASSTGSAGVHVDSTNIVYYNGGVVAATSAHGLTISGYIHLTVRVDETNKPKFTLYTMDGLYSAESNVLWAGTSITLTASTAASEFTDCKLSAAFDDTRKPIWYIGDSYMSTGDNRLPEWLKTADAYSKLCSIGYSGATVTGVSRTLNGLMSGGVLPAVLIWAIGMNNGDAASAINAQWKANTDALLEVCDSLGVEVILCTIPNTPTVNNAYKNAYVRSSNRRYVDYAATVNTSENGTEWIDGTLSADNTHPSVKGARLLAARLISDVPELVQ